MTDWQPTDPTAVEPVAEPTSSLAPDALQEGLALEALAADPRSAYWRGDDKHSAAEYQSRYLGLIRGELSGAPDEVAAPDQADPDMDHPVDVQRYDYSGLQVFNAADRDLVDSFAPVAFEAGIGTQKMRDALTWALTEETTSPAHFREWARKNHWPAAQVEAALKWHSIQQEKMK